MHIAESTWTDLDDADTTLAAVPVGSTEQHGPHAPLGTDTFDAEAVAAAGVDAYEGEVVLTPAIPVGISEEHRQFTGSLWVTEDTFRSYVREVVASLAHHGFDRVVLVNGHGGNVAALNEVAAKITRRDDAYAVAFTWFDEVGEHTSDMGHAGPLEISLLEHTDPDLVHEDRLEEAAAGASDGFGDWQGRVNLAVDFAEFTDNGVIGDPREADADRGEALLDLAADALADLFSVVADRDVSRPDHK